MFYISATTYAGAFIFEHWNNINESIANKAVAKEIRRGSETGTSLRDLDPFIAIPNLMKTVLSA